jgi:tetratricopeptide (TPR) repeat protein
VIATAFELFAARHYPGVVAVCTDALDDEPECVPLLLFRARANVALRRDLEAQADLRDVIRLDPRSGLAYRLLGELAARNDENDAATQFFREALRLDPDDREAKDWLLVVEALPRPAAGAARLPATAPAAGRFSPAPGPTPSAPIRFPRGTQPHEPHLDERPTQPFGRAATHPADPADTGPTGVRVVKPVAQPAALRDPIPTLTGRPAPQPPAKPAARLGSRTTTRMQIPELPGFGEYLVSSGILTRERLRVAQAYQRSMKVQLSTAIITLGLATPQRIEWAAVAHQSELAGDLR